MSTRMEELALELLSLPARTRGELAVRLIRSLEEEEAPEVDPSYIETAKRRASELAEGKAKGIPAEEVFREVREEVG